MIDILATANFDAQAGWRYLEGLGPTEKDGAKGLKIFDAGEATSPAINALTKLAPHLL